MNADCRLSVIFKYIFKHFVLILIEQMKWLRFTGQIIEVIY